MNKETAKGNSYIYFDSKKEDTENIILKAHSLKCTEDLEEAERLIDYINTCMIGKRDYFSFIVWQFNLREKYYEILIKSNQDNKNFSDWENGFFDGIVVSYVFGEK